MKMCQGRVDGKCLASIRRPTRDRRLDFLPTSFLFIAFIIWLKYVVLVAPENSGAPRYMDGRAAAVMPKTLLILL